MKLPKKLSFLSALFVIGSVYGVENYALNWKDKVIDPSAWDSAVTCLTEECSECKDCVSSVLKECQTCIDNVQTDCNNCMENCLNGGEDLTQCRMKCSNECNIARKCSSECNCYAKCESECRDTSIYTLMKDFCPSGSVAQGNTYQYQYHHQHRHRHCHHHHGRWYCYDLKFPFPVNVRNPQSEETNIEQNTEQVLTCEDLSIIPEIYYSGLELYANACSNECQYIDKAIKGKIAALDEFIRICEEGGNCDKNTLDRIVGINTCFLQSLKNDRQNHLSEGKKEKLERFTYNLINRSLNGEILGDTKTTLEAVFLQLETKVANDLEGHYQQIWSDYIWSTSEIYSPLNISNGDQFCQELRDIYNANDQPVEIAERLKDLLIKFDTNFLNACVNVACEKALTDTIFTHQTCHNYFVEVKNNFQNKRNDLEGKLDKFSTNASNFFRNYLLSSTYDVNRFADNFCGRLEDIKGQVGKVSLEEFLQEIADRLYSAYGELCQIENQNTNTEEESQTEQEEQNEVSQNENTTTASSSETSTESSSTATAQSSTATTSSGGSGTTSSEGKVILWMEY